MHESLSELSHDAARVAHVQTALRMAEAHGLLKGTIITGLALCLLGWTVI